MKDHPLRATMVGALAVFLAAIGLALPAHAARVGVLTNRYASQTAADLSNRIPGHSFAGIDTAVSLPTLPTLLASYDILLVYEDMTYANAPAVGNVAAAFARSGRAVVLGTFYEQDRSDGAPGNSPHGWGDLEKLDPNTTDGVGTPYAPRSLDPGSLRPHPLTEGVAALSSAKFAGGNDAKPDSIVLATWNVPNARGRPDPAIAFRVTDGACVIHIAIAPNYPLLGAAGIDFGGDFTRVWQNAFDFGATACTPLYGRAPGGDPANVPTLSEWALMLTLLLVGGVGALTLRRRETHATVHRRIR